MITVEVKATLARGKSMCRLLGPYAIQSIVTCHPGLAKYLPWSQETYYSNYAVPIDIECMKELELFIGKLPGHMNVGMDGATVNSAQKLVYTLTKAGTCVFLNWSDMGSLKHQAAAKVADAFWIRSNAVDKYYTPLASTDVDNAVRGVAAQVVVLFKTKHDVTVLVLRDHSRYVDLCSKDLAKTDVVSGVVSHCKIVTDFTKIDRIQSMKREMLRDGHLEEGGESGELVLTRIQVGTMR